MAVEIIETQGNQVNPDPQKPEAQKPPVKEEPKYVRLEDLEKISQAINNTRDYNNRQLSELRAEIQKLTPPKPVSTGDKDLDEMVQIDWKAAVEKVTEQVLQRERQRVAAESEAERTTRILEESKSKVMERHQELSDPDSPKTKVFLKVLDENPDFKVNPRGPILAMYEMETRLKSSGTLELETLKKERSRATSIPVGTPGVKKEYTLSKADLDFCRMNGINPENYKKLKGQREASA